MLTALIVSILTACMPVEDSPRLHVVEVIPDLSAPLPAGTPIRVRFGEYLDPERLGSVDLVSGDLAFAIGVGYDPVDRALVLLPELNLRPRLGYRLTISADGGPQGLHGGGLAEDLVVEFTAAAAAAPVPRPPVVFADVAPIFANRCGCHGPDVAPALTEAALVDQPSARQPGVLVEPGRPLESQLVLRLLPDYPGVRGATMPLGGTIDDDEVRAIIDWVSGLR